MRSIKLPRRLVCLDNCSLGGDGDPAILVKYVRDGISRLLQERALWDYKVDLASQVTPTTFYRVYHGASEYP